MTGRANSPRMLHMGGAVVDYVYRVAQLPPRGGESVATVHARLPGGGFNQMAAARRSGLAVAYGGGHGSGPDGGFLCAAFNDSGIDVLQTAQEDIDSGNCVVLIDDEGERSFVSWPGAEGRLSDAMVGKIRAAPGDWVVVSGYTLSYVDSRDVLARWIQALPPSQPVVLDPAPVVASIPASIREKVLARATWVSANLDEARLLTGEYDPALQAAALLDRLCPSARGILLRAGAAGTRLHCRGAAPVHVPAFPVEAVDTNGAGDTHLGVFVAVLAQGGDAPTATLRANAAAALSVTRFGGASAPATAEIDALLAGQGPQSAGALTAAKP